MIRPILNAWGYYRRKDNRANLGYAAVNWERLLQRDNRTDQVVTDRPFDASELEAVDRLVAALAMRRFPEYRVLMVEYIEGWDGDEKLPVERRVEKARCKRRTYYNRLYSAENAVQRLYLQETGS